MSTGAVTENLPPLLSRGPALELLRGMGVKRGTFDKWRALKLIRPVPLPGHKWEHYRREELIKLANG